MNKVICVVLVLLLLCSCSWNREEIVMETTWQVLHVLDWGTTLDIAARPDEFYEMNPILGEYPSRGQVNAYMFTGAILHPIVTHLLPREADILGKDTHPRRLFQAITIGMSGACVVNNFSIGLKLNF